MRPEFVELARRHGVATVFADTDDYPSFADRSADFVYARLMRCESACATGIPRGAAIATWANACAPGARAASPTGSCASRRPLPASAPRDVFLFFISGAKERAPAAAVALLAELGRHSVR